MPGVVTVACKIPMGIVLQEFKMMPEREQTPQGVRDIQVGRPTGKAAVINGTAHAPGRHRVDQSGNPVHITQSGYALTQNVDADLWESWLLFHKDHPMVQNRIIYASTKSGDIGAIGRENEARTSGLEPMRPDGDPRAPARRTSISDGRTISEVSTATAPPGAA